MDRKKVLLQAIESGFEVTSEGIPCETEYAKEGYALDYVIEGNDGGVGDQTKNLIVYPYFDTTKTVSGITFTDNGDGSITIAGTATNRVFYHLIDPNKTNVLKLSAAKYYFSDNCDNSSSPRRFLIQAKKNINGVLNNVMSQEGGNNVVDLTELEFDRIWVVLAISAGDTFDNVTFKPQLELGETATEYELYGYKIPIVYCGNGNLFNYTEPIGQIQADQDGWFDITIDNSTGTSTKYANCRTKVNPSLKTGTSYYVYYEVAEKSGDLNVWVTEGSPVKGDSGQFASSLGNKSGFNTTRDSFDECKSMTRTTVTCAAGKSGHIKFRIAVYKTKKDTFTPYTIPQTMEILLDAPLKSGESIRYTSDNLPALPLQENGNSITVGTTVQPTNLTVTYRAKVK